MIMNPVWSIIGSSSSENLLNTVRRCAACVRSVAAIADLAPLVDLDAGRAGLPRVRLTS